MPFVQNGDASIYFEEHGKGFPVLLLSAGFMYSRIDSWPRLERTFPAYRFDPLVHCLDDLHMIAMDQRNALGQSVAPIKPTDGWLEFAGDQLAVMDSLGIDRFHVWGGCIGAPFALKLCELAPDRVVSVVMQDPIGVDPRKPLASVDLVMSRYAPDILAARPDLDKDDIEKFARNLYEHDFETGNFAFSVDRAFLKGCEIPMLIMPGWDDEYHPQVTSDEIDANAPNTEYDRDWMERSAEFNRARIVSFLAKHTPAS